jgi:hypothetical protein
MVSYSSVEFDEFIGIIIDNYGIREFDKGDKVCVVLDYNYPSFYFVKSANPLKELLVSVDSIFKITSAIDDEDLPKIIPLIKYGTICCYIIQNFNINSHSIIHLDASVNIYKLMSNLFKCKTTHVNSKLSDNCEISISMKDNILNILTKDNHEEHINFHFKNIFDVFGIENVKKVVDYVITNNLLADVIHITPNDFFSRTNKSSRFFDIIEIC